MVRMAEEQGVDRLWLASHLFQREPIAMAGAALAASPAAKIVLTALSPYVVHPVYCAMAAATLDEFYPGRVALCLGVGAPRDLQSCGVEAARPLAVMQEAIAVVRALFSGETIQHDGQIFKVRDRALATGPSSVPIFLAASGHHMLRLAGRSADGVVISAAASPEFLTSCLMQVAAGEAQAGRRVQRLGYVFGAVNCDPAMAYAALRRSLAFILRGKHHGPNLEQGGSSLDQDALAEAFITQNWPRVEQLMTDEIVRKHSASGSESQVRDRIARYGAAGLDEIVLIGSGGLDSLCDLIRIAKGTVA
jgi:5,10-methylenetetrahydromethanopterin reductase